MLQYKIKQYRTDLNMTQEELAEVANVSRATIAALESGRARETTTETLRKIAKALNRKVSEIILE